MLPVSGGNAEPASAPVRVTVVVPARNEADTIEACLLSILAQTVTDLQVLVVDGSSDDATVQIVRRLAAEDARIDLIEHAPRGIPVALNTALAKARGTWLVRVDAHSTVPPDYVARVVAHLETGRWGGVGGRKDAVALGPNGRAIAAALASRFGVGNSLYHYGRSPQQVDHVPFGAYPLALVRSLGGWNEDLEVNEDFEFDDRVRRAGRPILFDPEVRIAWRSRSTMTELFRQYRRYGRGKVDVALLHPRSVKARHLAAPALVLWLVLLLVLAPRRPSRAAALLAPYLLASLVASVRTSPQLDRSARVRLPLAFLAMHLGWGLGFWEGVVRRVSRPLRRRQ